MGGDCRRNGAEAELVKATGEKARGKEVTRQTKTKMGA
jgi:hypothetical protein